MLSSLASPYPPQLDFSSEFIRRAVPRGSIPLLRCGRKRRENHCMKLLRSVIGLALVTLRENMIRSFFTVLGVIIGTGTIIAVGSILAGLDGAVTGVIRSFGTNTAIVFKMRMGPGFSGRTAEERNRKPLDYE